MNLPRIQVVSPTPIEKVEMEGFECWVKREDLSCPEPGPSFSKVRGVEKHLRGRPERFIGVLDTYHSKAGWGVSSLCLALGKQAVVYYPVFKNDNGLRDNQIKCLEWGAILRPLPGKYMSGVLYSFAKKDLATIPHSYMMPNALKLKESVEATAAEVMTVPDEFLDGTLWVVSISSGTIGAGIILGLQTRRASARVVLHMGYSRPIDSVIQYLKKKTGLNRFSIRIDFVDEGYGYRDVVEDDICPFPCNPYYDRKAWKWLVKNQNSIAEPKVLFWNIGA